MPQGGKGGGVPVEGVAGAAVPHGGGADGVGCGLECGVEVVAAECGDVFRGGSGVVGAAGGGRR
ncbi:hypothetical protein GCM10025331_72580 [Actinoplanes utahensis]|nr:hypothetical protein Aut01nite_68330 [Actinoplanes utahensis]